MEGTIVRYPDLGLGGFYLDQRVVDYEKEKLEANDLKNEALSEGEREVVQSIFVITDETNTDSTKLSWIVRLGLWFFTNFMSGFFSRNVSDTRSVEMSKIKTVALENNQSHLVKLLRKNEEVSNLVPKSEPLNHQEALIAHLESIIG